MNSYSTYYYIPFVQTFISKIGSGRNQKTHAHLLMQMYVPQNYTWEIEYEPTGHPGRLMINLTEVVDGSDTHGEAEGLRVIYYRLEKDITTLPTTDDASAVPYFEVYVTFDNSNEVYSTNALISGYEIEEATNQNADFYFVPIQPFLQLVNLEATYGDNYFGLNAIVKLNSGDRITSVDESQLEEGVLNISVETGETGAPSCFCDNYVFVDKFQRASSEITTATVNILFDGANEPTGTGNLDFDDADAGTDPVIVG